MRATLTRVRSELIGFSMDKILEKVKSQPKAAKIAELSVGAVLVTVGAYSLLAK